MFKGSRVQRNALSLLRENAARAANILVGCLLTIPAIADYPVYQWQVHPNLVMLDLVKSGYKIVGMTREPPVDVDGTAETYILQKDTSVYRCDEFRSRIPHRGVPAVQFMCMELVKPTAALKAVPIR